MRLRAHFFARSPAPLLRFPTYFDLQKLAFSTNTLSKVCTNIYQLH
jgi:hypothetical protein